MHIWLRQAMSVMLPDLEGLPAGPEGQESARTWFAHLLGRFVARGLRTPGQQKNYLVDVRNHIRVHLGQDHPALSVVGFDEATWQGINLPTHDRVEERNQHQRLLKAPEKIVARAAKLLSSAHSQDLAVGLAVTIGRRISELLDSEAKLEPVSAWSVRFTGQRKHRGPDRGGFAFEIPTLVPAEAVLAAWGRLKVMVGDEKMSPRHINARFGSKVNQAADVHFRALIPPRPGDDALYLHLFRAVYATIAVHWFCPPRVNRVLYKAEIQGHRQILDAAAARNPTMRRSYAASRHYDDYQIADATGQNIDGRQGIRLHEDGVELLRVFGDAADDLNPSSHSEPLFEAPANPVRMKAPTPAVPTASQEPSSPTPALEDALPPALTPKVTVAATSDAAGPAAPAEAPQAPPTPAVPTKRAKPGTYRLHAEDRPRLDAFRSHPEQSQADNLGAVIALAAGAAAACEQTRELATRIARTGTLEDEVQATRAEAQTLRDQLATEREENRRLHVALDAARGQSTSAGAGGALLAVARELLEVAVAAAGSPLQPRLLRLASQALGGLQPNDAGGGGREGRPSATTAATPATTARFGPLFAGGAAAPPESTAVAAGPVTTLPVPRGDAPEAVDPERTADTQGGGTTNKPAPVEGDEVADHAAPPVDDTGKNPPRPSPTPPSPRSGRTPRATSTAAAEKIDRAVQAVAGHNEAQGSHAKKWAITEGSIATLTGCFRPAIRRYFEEHKDEIEAHNARHDLSGGFNRGRGKRGQRIEDEIAARPPATSGADSTLE